MTRCPDCGAPNDEASCVDYFHTLGVWELENQLYDVHHLMVLCYHLQHPHLYSARTLTDAQGMLVDFVEGGVTSQAMRKKIAKSVDSGVRKHKIAGTSDDHGAYAQPIAWAMTIADVVAAGRDGYYASVNAWARATLAIAEATGSSAAQLIGFGGPMLLPLYTGNRPQLCPPSVLR